MSTITTKGRDREADQRSPGLVRATLETEDVTPDVSEALDDAAGCEFVDDRIREDDESTAAEERP
jgi:hypothetical protein